MKKFSKDICSAFTMVLLAYFSAALAPNASAVDAPPDGGYPNGNTAEGTNALFSITNGDFNTAIGESALYSNTQGRDNTGVGLPSALPQHVLRKYCDR